VKSTWRGRRAFILGFGESGYAAAHFLLRRGAHVTALDGSFEAESKKQRAKELAIPLCPDRPVALTAQDLLLLSPGINFSHPVVQSAVSAGCEVIGEVELALQELSHRCIAITGTNGKTTVTLLVTHVLRFCGFAAFAVGNVGTYGQPFTAALDDLLPSQAILVAELSSYQLESAYTAAVDAAALLNLTQDHLDRHISLEGYARAKGRLKALLKETATFFVQERSYLQFPHLFCSAHTSIFGWQANSATNSEQGQKGLYANATGVWENGVLLYSWQEHPYGSTLAPHTAENELAALALCRTFGITCQQFLQSLPSFVRPKHRCEEVATINGTVYYDDSKGTNVDAVLQAVAAIPHKIILIAGGVDKGSDYTVWRSFFKNKVKVVLTIGQAAYKIEQQLAGCIPTEHCGTLSQAVNKAYSLAVTGEAIVLSPGCSSYDMFADYADRGRTFQQLVRAL